MDSVGIEVWRAGKGGRGKEIVEEILQEVTWNEWTVILPCNILTPTFVLGLGLVTG